MTVNEVITLARAGELLQLSPAIKNDDNVMVGFINLGLIELYKRFQLRTGEALVTLRTGKTIYKLDGTDTDVSMDEPYFYLIAAYGDRDLNDYNNSMDDVLPINSEDDVFSVNTTSYDAVQIPLITDGAMVSLIYSAKPAKMVSTSLTDEVPVPDQFIEALLHYIGYRAHGSMDGNIQTESNTHYMRFEKACDKLRELGVGIAPDDIDMNERLSMRGFV